MSDAVHRLLGIHMSDGYAIPAGYCMHNGADSFRIASEGNAGGLVIGKVQALDQLPRLAAGFTFRGSYLLCRICAQSCT